MFVRGSGTELWDDDGKRYLDFLCGLAVTSSATRIPAVAEAIAEQARTLSHVSNLFGTEPQVEVAADASTGLLGRRRARCSSATRAPRPTRPRSSWRASAAGAAATSWCRLPQLPRAHAGDAARHRSTREARAVPAHARGLPPRRVQQRRRARSGARPERRAPSCSSRCRAKAASIPADADYVRGVPAAVRRARHLVDLRRGADRLRPHRQVVRIRAFRYPRPTSSRWPRRWATACPSVRAGRAPTSAAAFKPGDHGTTFGGQPLAASAARAVLQVMQRHRRAGVVAPKRGAAVWREALRALPGVATCAVWVCCWAPNSRPRCSTARGEGRRQRVPRCRSRRQRRHDTAIRFAPPLNISEAELDEGIDIFAGVLEEHDVMRHVLEVDDLSADELATRARPVRAADVCRVRSTAKAWR